MMSRDVIPAGDSVSAAVLPIADLAPDHEAQFVVRGSDTFLRCAQAANGALSFPAKGEAKGVEVGPQGVLYSFSTVHVSSSRATPYTIGYVDFPGNLRVLAPVKGIDAMTPCDCLVRLANDGAEWFVEPVKEGAK